MASNIFRVRRLVFAGLAMAGAAVLLVAGFIGYSAYTLPLLHAPAAEVPPAAILYATGAGAPFAARGVYRGEKIAADRLPADLVHAVIAIEDRRFYRHGGVDPHGIMRAAWRNLWSRGIEGGSTITQQLARLNYLSNERAVRRKVQEIMLALWLEARLSKEEILARYLNSVYFGAGAYGADAAAKRYFGKKAGDLDLAESAMLAGLIRAPSHLAPTRNLAGARRRAELVLHVMVETGAIDEARAAATRAQPVRLAIPPDTEPDDNYFIDAAEAEIKRLVGTPPLDLAVATTFDPRLQEAAERVVKRWLAEGARRRVGQAALLALAPDGAILAMVGGRDYSESQFNRTTQAKRQPGSLFKVFVYLTALSNGYTADSVIVDQPVQIGDWQPKNYDGRYRGPVPLRTAFAQSLNTVSAQLVQALGAKRVIEMARSLGVHSELPAVPSLALGSAEVTLIEMVRAMAAIATNTKSIEPYAVRTIKAEAAAPLYTRPETANDRPEWNRAAMLPLLEAVVTEGTGKAARLDRRSAGKTGTTDEYRDAWFVGFTSSIVAGVWVGNDDNSPTDRVAGGDIPAKIWHDFVSEAERILARPSAPAQRPPTTGPAPGPSTSAPAAAPSGTATAPSASPPPVGTLPSAASAVPSAPGPPISAPAAAPSGTATAPSASPPPAGTLPSAASAVPSAPGPPISAPAAAPSGTATAPAGPTPPAVAPVGVRGVPVVVDSATLFVNGARIHLNGVAGEAGAPAQELARYIGGREVACEPVDRGAPQFRCTIGGYDLGEAILLNGAGRAAGDAPERMRGAEQNARRAGRGIWAR